MGKGEAADKLKEALVLLEKAEKIVNDVEDNRHMSSVEDAGMGLDEVIGNVKYAIKDLEW
jgi:hypothetical protein